MDARRPPHDRYDLARDRNRPMPIDDPKFLIVVLVVVVVLLLIFTGVPGRKATDRHDRVCRACRLAHPYFAQFCRKCGGKL
jgi:hypothetical protein